MMTLAAASENNWWIPLVGVVIGGLITIISNFAATWWTDRLKRATERQQLAGAICGELKGILSLVEHRKIASILRRSVWEPENCNICHSRFARTILRFSKRTS